MLNGILKASQKLWSHIAGRPHSNGTGKAEREERCSIERSLVYRRSGGYTWYQGEAINISPGGILFSGERNMSLGSEIEVSYSLPPEHEGQRNVDIFCWANVVRLTPPAKPGGKAVVAAKVLRYRSEPKPLPDVRRIIGEVRGPMARLKEYDLR
jgi:PilZ domain